MTKTDREFKMWLNGEWCNGKLEHKQITLITDYVNKLLRRVNKDD